MFDWKLWYSQNRTSLLDKMRFYREQHREKARRYRKLYYENTKETPRLNRTFQYVLEKSIYILN